MPTDSSDKPPMMDEITACGLDIDQRMALDVDDAFDDGTDAIHVLSLWSCPIFQSGVLPVV